MSKIKKIPYGMTNLETIIREGYYYVDKTRFIPRLEDEGRFVIFLRPRRYGKSLTIAMLDAYYTSDMPTALMSSSVISTSVSILRRNAIATSC